MNLLHHLKRLGPLGFLRHAASVFVGTAPIALRKALLKLLFAPHGLPGNQLRPYVQAISPIPVRSRHWEVTLLHSVDTARMATAPSVALITAVLKATEYAAGTRLPLLEAREKATNTAEMRSLLARGFSANIWPGEHYRLLYGLARAVNARCIVEIGTFWGGGALALREGLAEGGTVFTFDILPWRSFPSTQLCSEDFSDGRLVQVLGDLTDSAVFGEHRSLIERADLIFMDAAKDGIMERKFLKYFSQCQFKSGALLVIDDIRLWNMLDIWQDITQPKIDITGLGHYTGTGIVQLGVGSNGLEPLLTMTESV
jgi:predicted O-methyltransferase YrrM